MHTPRHYKQSYATASLPSALLVSDPHCQDEAKEENSRLTLALEDAQTELTVEMEISRVLKTVVGMVVRTCCAGWCHHLYCRGRAEQGGTVQS